MAIRISYLIIELIEGIIFYLYCSTLFKARLRRWISLLALLALYVLLSLLSAFGLPWLNLTGFFLCNFICLLVLYRVPCLSSLFHAVITTAVMAVSEVIVIFIAPYDLTFSFSGWEDFEVWVFPVVIEKAICFLVLMLFAHFANARGKAAEKQNKSVWLLVIPSILSLFIMYTFLTIRANTVLPAGLNVLSVISAFLLLFLNIGIWGLYNYNAKKTAELTDLQLMCQKESDTLDYYKMLISQDENQRQLIHDMKNHLQAIEALNQKGDREKIEAYVNRILGSAGLQSSIRISGNEFLNSILCRYVSLCRQADIAFHADIRDNSLDFLKEDDMTSLICNLLDNAVESASRMPDARIDLASYHQEGTAYSVITLENSCRKDPFRPDSRTLLSSKPEPSSHGYGLKIIRRVADDYGGETQNYYSAEDNMLHTIITLNDPR